MRVARVRSLQLTAVPLKCVSSPSASLPISTSTTSYSSSPARDAAWSKAVWKPPRASARPASTASVPM